MENAAGWIQWAVRAAKKEEVRRYMKIQQIYFFLFTAKNKWVAVNFQMTSDFKFELVF